MLIGDSGYAIEPFLMAKLQETQTPAENLYNESILRTRNVVERQYVWGVETTISNPFIRNAS
jgi:hypothetical protein